MLSSCGQGLHSGVHKSAHGGGRLGGVPSTQVVPARPTRSCMAGKRQQCSSASSRGCAQRVSALPNKDSSKRGAHSQPSSSAPQRSPVAVHAAAPATASQSSHDISVRIDNDTDKACSIVCVRFPRRPGLLPALSNAFKDLCEWGCGCLPALGHASLHASCSADVTHRVSLRCLPLRGNPHTQTRIHTRSAHTHTHTPLCMASCLPRT